MIERTPTRTVARITTGCVVTITVREGETPSDALNRYSQKVAEQQARNL